MKNRMTLLSAMILVAVAVAACGGSTADSPAPAAPAIAIPATASPPTAPSLADLPPIEAPGNASTAPFACEEFFGFCVTAAVSGSVASTGTAGVGSRSKNDCATWAAGGGSRILELPMMFGAGKDKITVALSRIGVYTGPGAYELTAQANGGNPDMFPTIEVAGRTFSSGAGSTAVVTVAADGSGTVQATGLIELASIQISNPDPSARVAFSMQWMCQEGS